MKPVDPFAELLRCKNAGRPSVLATVVRTAGSTPRKQAARMLVTAAPGGGVVVTGTIGGGRVEKEVTDAALALLREGASAEPRLLRYHLTHELAMCCGGEMEVFLEPIVPEPTLVVCGGGHVARALVPLARTVGFVPVVADEPPDDAPESDDPAARFPDAARLLDTWDVRDWKDVPLGAETYVVIVTRDHAADQRLVEALWDHDLAYLGLIGSRRKIEMFRRRLEAKGRDPARWDRIHAPIGLDIGAETPEEIAVAIVAELIAVRATRAGRPLGKKMK